MEGPRTAAHNTSAEVCFEPNTTSSGNAGGHQDHAGLTPRELDSIAQVVTGGLGNIQDIYPLTPLQEGMLFDCLLHDKRDTYIFSTLFEFDSRLAFDLWIKAMNAVIGRHDVMRSLVVWQHVTRPVQVIVRTTHFPVHEIPLNPARSTVNQFKEMIHPRLQRTIELSKAPLAHILVAPEAHGNKLYALLQIHHLISDLQSLRVLVSEAFDVLENRQSQLPAPERYDLYVAERLRRAPEDETNARAFFRTKLNGFNEPSAPFDILDIRGDSLLQATCVTEPALVDRIRSQALRLGVSAARIFHAAFGVLVARTSGRDDVVFGTVMSVTRHGGGSQKLLGLTVNTLPLRLSLRGMTAESLIRKTHTELNDLLERVHSPLALAKINSGLTGGTPLFTTLLNYRRSTHETTWDSGSGVRVLARGEAPTNYPLLISIDDHSDEFVLTAQTDPRMDPNRILSFLCTSVRSLVESLERASEIPAVELPILSDSEWKQVIEYFNDTDTPYPHDRAIHELIEEQVRRTPDAIAIAYEGHSLAYAELERNATQLSRYLRCIEVGPDRLVGLCLERSIDMVVALLAILKAGGAYVPLDPTHPPERLAYILNNARPKVVLTHDSLRDRFPNTTTPLISLDDDWETLASLSIRTDSRDYQGVQPDNLAYVIYTSGSTGQPKGAMNEHRAVVNRLHWMQNRFHLGPNDRVLQKTPFGFDVSVWEFFWPLMCGASLIMARPQGHMDPTYLRTVIEQENVTTLHFVPSMLQAFLEEYRTNSCSSLKRIICSGEELPTSLLRKCFTKLPKVQISNLYGPTEAAIDVTAWDCRREDADSRVPIGQPIANTKIYILDNHLHPVPIGVTGQIYIGGLAVGRGYINRPELTEAQFLTDPFSVQGKRRMYKTGDLGRWRADGAVEYLGRVDHQVKIRGVRIEPGEIEAQLRLHKQVNDAVVVPREDIPGELRLVAYVVLSNRIEMTGAHSVGSSEPPCSGNDLSSRPALVASDQSLLPKLRQYLALRLPEHMIPSAWVALNELPVTANGKLDRRALPAPPTRSKGLNELVIPSNDVERTIATIWQQVLGIAHVGADDSFFELGGHSILATRVVSRIRELLTVELPIRAVFDAPTVRQLAGRVSAERSLMISDAPQDIRAEIDRLSDDEVLKRISELETQFGTGPLLND